LLQLEEGCYTALKEDCKAGDWIRACLLLGDTMVPKDYLQRGYFIKLA